VAILGLLEIAAIVAFFELKGLATTVCASVATAVATPQPAAGNAGAQAGAAPLAGAPQSDEAQSPLPSAPASQPSASAVPADSSSAPGGAAGAAGDAHVAGDTNQIVDPNCVGKTAAGLLSENTPPPGPTCGPMKQSEALKQAERQIQK
jgi:hypothetical protein